MTFGRNLTGSGFSALQTNNIRGIVANNLTASGTTQATATDVFNDVNIFTTVASGAGAQLPPCDIGDDLQICNYGANACLVWGQVGDSIQNGSVNGSFSIGVNKTAYFTRISTTAWSAVLST
jgi:hypothetical protein